MPHRIAVIPGGGIGADVTSAAPEVLRRAQPGGRVHRGTPDKVAVEPAIFTGAGVDRILRLAVARARGRSGRLISVTRSTAPRHAVVFRDEKTDRRAAGFPDVRGTRRHAGAVAAVWSGAMMPDHRGDAAAAARGMTTRDRMTARGIGTVPGGDRTGALTAAVRGDM